MNSLDFAYLEAQAIPIEMGGMLQKLGEYKGKQDLFTHQTPQVLQSLREIAIVQSTESSNRIEGVTVDADRFKKLMAHKTKPRDRSEAEVVGYRNVLARIHTRFQSIELDSKTILEMHQALFQFTGNIAGIWKRKDNSIEERLDDGRWITRFNPVSAAQTPRFMEDTLTNFHRLWNQQKISPLLIIPAFVLDFLCVHPFTDGNGRVSRLLTLFLLHRAGYEVGRYVSLERIIEDSKESYYEALQLSSQHWHEKKHRLKPWWEYFLGILIKAYQEFEARVGMITKSKGAKTGFIRQAVENLPHQFGISDVERASPSVSRDMIRVVLNQLRKEKVLICKGAGRNARWEKKSR